MNYHSIFAATDDHSVHRRRRRSHPKCLRSPVFLVVCVQMTGYTVLLLLCLGPSVLAGIGVMILLIPVSPPSLYLWRDLLFSWVLMFLGRQRVEARVNRCDGSEEVLAGLPSACEERGSQSTSNVKIPEQRSMCFSRYFLSPLTVYARPSFCEQRVG